MKKVLLFTVLMLFSAFSLLEVFQRYMYFKSYFPRHLPVFCKFQDFDYVWKERFIKRFNKGRFVWKGAHIPHPTRGWTPKANFRRTLLNGKKISTNNRGHRGTRDYIYYPDKFTVLIVGDSFTFGISADDNDVWPTILSQYDERLNIINLGVGGYGTGQMYITLKESIEEYKPQLVVFAYVDEDLSRAMLRFRDYRKPKLLLQGQYLVITNTPIGSIDQTYKEVMDNNSDGIWRGFKPVTLYIIQELYNRITFKDRMFALNEKIVEETIKTSYRHKSDFLLVNLAYGSSIKDKDSYDIGEDFLNYFLKRQNKNVSHIATRKHFLDIGKEWVQGHYQKREAALVAKVLYDKIRMLPSFKTF